MGETQIWGETHITATAGPVLNQQDLAKNGWGHLKSGWGEVDSVCAHMHGTGVVRAWRQLSCQ